MSLVIPTDAWLPVIPEITSDPSNRDPDLYLQCCRQFPVETHPRYVMGHTGHNETYCNIYVADCTLALGAGIPHWINPKDGTPLAVGRGTETSANGVCEWLKNFGPNFGWTEVGVDEAFTSVVAGKPTVIVWENPGGIGHVAMMLPTSRVFPPHSAQAGAINFFDEDYRKGFGTYPF